MGRNYKRVSKKKHAPAALSPVDINKENDKEIMYNWTLLAKYKAPI